MKVPIHRVTGGKSGSSMELPVHFMEPIRKDLIKRAVLAVQSHNYQPYGADPHAGTRQGDATPKRRNKYKTVYGRGVSRVKRKAMWHRGTQFRWVAAFIANARSGRRAFPPKAEKVIIEKINDKERKKAIRSAIAATKSLVIEDRIESLKKTKDANQMLAKLELSEKKRGKGPLIIVSKSCDTLKAVTNLAGVDATQVDHLNAELLAPGTNPGRITLWSKSAVEALDKRRLFI